MRITLVLLINVFVILCWLIWLQCLLINKLTGFSYPLHFSKLLPNFCNCVRKRYANKTNLLILHFRTSARCPPRSRMTRNPAARQQHQVLESNYYPRENTLKNDFSVHVGLHESIVNPSFRFQKVLIFISKSAFSESYETLVMMIFRHSVAKCYRLSALSRSF